MRIRRGNMRIKQYLAGTPAASTVLLSRCAASAVTSYKASGVPEDKKLIVYTSHKGGVHDPVVKEFEERTGIWVQVRAGGIMELLDAVSRKNGKDSCDVMFDGSVESYDAYKEYLQLYRCSQGDLLDDTFLSPDNSWAVFTELPIVFTYNNKLVDRSDTPSSWRALLDERWKGKVVFTDPGESGTSYTALATMIQVLGMGEEAAMTAFTGALDGNVSAGSGEVVSEVASGTRLVGIILEEAARRRMAMDEDISIIYLSEGTSAVPDGCALVKGARHVDNAKLFIDSTVSDNVQKLAVDQFFRRTVRTDLSQGATDDEIKITDFDLVWASSRQERVLEMWLELVK